MHLFYLQCSKISFNFTIKCIRSEIHQVSCCFVFIIKNSLIIPEHIADFKLRSVCRDKCVYGIDLLQRKLTWLKHGGNVAPVSNEQFHHSPINQSPNWGLRETTNGSPQHYIKLALDAAASVNLKEACSWRFLKMNHLSLMAGPDSLDRFRSHTQSEPENSLLPAKKKKKKTTPKTRNSDHNPQLGSSSPMS